MKQAFKTIVREHTDLLIDKLTIGLGIGYTCLEYFIDNLPVIISLSTLVLIWIRIYKAWKRKIKE